MMYLVEKEIKVTFRFCKMEVCLTSFESINIDNLRK